ncbi:MAG: ABC transporter ATP-binding protein/permease [Deltaproteobacteria bacterium]|jgi:ATP-binding cassette subfamily B protein|nr:ABC transporter ATP-binding protein/permease [Deltaproteobacteria bacterium]
MTNFSIIAPYFRVAAFCLTLGFFALTICDISQMLIPRLVGRIIDLLADHSATGRSFLPMLGMIVGLAAIVAILRYAWRHLIYGFSRRLEKDLRRRLQERFLALSVSWHQTNSSGDMMALATNDIESVRLAVGFGLVSLVDAVVLGLSAVAFMLSIDPYLSLWAFIPMPLITVLTGRFGTLIYRRMLDAQDLFGRLTEVVREQLSGLKVIRAMALEPLAQAEVAEVSENYMKKNIRLSLLMGGFFPLMVLLTNLALALTLYIGGKATIFGSISPGDFVAFISYLTLLSWPMMALGLTLGLIQQGMASLGRLGRVLKATEKSVHPQGPAAFKLPEGPFEIQFENVSFSYPGDRGEVLKNISFSLPAGEAIGLAGQTGCGKSTLAALIVALYEPTGGRILIDHRDSTQWPLEDLRGLFGYVPQDGHVFTGTMRNNLAFGCPQASDEALIKAAEAAALPLDPKVFPEGLDTLIGERGLTLSGGQRQRLALARALVLDPPFLILDDTLSAVDAAVEEQILSSLIPLRRGRGTLIISHRMTSLARASRVLSLEDGRLSQEGSFDELISAKGYLARLAELTRLGADGYVARSSSMTKVRK